ncbi:MAG TPA: response regulator [Acholeplasmataceae bacterium]|nr:response regulator [Acholeplasmataceae bacterium]
MFDMNRAISVIMHEIKSPLNAIMGIVEMAKIRGTTEKKYLEYLEQIKSISMYMISLSNNILENFKQNYKAPKQVKENFFLGGLTDEVTNIFRCQFHKKNMDFHYEIDEGGNCVVLGDSLKLKQILINILANSVKFTPNGGRIEFLVKTTQNDVKLEAEFKIRDNGPGMSAEFLERIFLPFVQEDNNKCGTGLGLMIVHQYVQQLGGTIDVKSKKGEGTEFVVNLSLEYGEKQKQSENNFSSKRILLVDDSMINLEVVSFILKEKGVEIDVASNGKIAFDKFVESDENHYDLILMDMRMPVLSGCEATKAIRTLTRKDAQEIKIIGFSSNSLNEDICEALASGMNDYVCKPIEAAKLYKILDKYL